MLSHMAEKYQIRIMTIKVPEKRQTELKSQFAQM